MNEFELHNIIHDYIVFATGLPNESVIPAYSNQDMQTYNDRGAIVTINLINPTPIGKDTLYYKDVDNDNVEEIVFAHRNITASIKVFEGKLDGNTASDLMDKISSYLIRTKAKSIFYNSGNSIGVIRKGNVIDLPEVLNGSYNSIKQLDIDFHINNSDGLNVNAINSSTIEVESHSGSHITNTQIEVQQ